MDSYPPEQPIHPNILGLARLLSDQMGNGEIEIHVVPHPMPNRGWDIVVRFDGGYRHKREAEAQAEFLAQRLCRLGVPGTKYGTNEGQVDTTTVRPGSGHGAQP